MKSSTIFLLLLFLFSGLLFAGSQSESGRESGFESIAGGQFINPDEIDAESYLEDFTFDYKARPGQDLSIFVEIENEFILTRGGRLNLQIGLRTNSKSFYPKQNMNYILFIHNPGLLRYDEALSELSGALAKIKKDMDPGDKLGLYSVKDKKIHLIETESSIGQVLDEIKTNIKVYKNDDILTEALKAMNEIPNEYPRRFLWITDEDLVKDQSDAGIFSFSLKLYSQNKTSFSYLGYGEESLWATINTYLRDAGGSSYYVKDYSGLEATIMEDYSNFSHPTVEDIRINLSIYPYIQALQNDYRVTWYPSLSDFRPNYRFYNRPINYHFIKNMDYDTHKIFIHYLCVGAQNIILMNEFLRDKGYDKTIPIGMVSVEYYSNLHKEYRYVSEEINITYTDTWNEQEDHINPIVRKFTLIQNTPFILKEISQIVSQNRDYFTAILLVDNQINRLSDLESIYKDKEIGRDIENLMKYKELLMGQARSLNYIQ